MGNDIIYRGPAKMLKLLTLSHYHRWITMQGLLPSKAVKTKREGRKLFRCLSSLPWRADVEE